MKVTFDVDLTDMTPITLSDLRDKLWVCNKEAAVYFDFCGLVPIKLASYRGDYSQLALGYKEDATLTVGQLLVDVLEALGGKTFEGYKGGTYKMFPTTSVYVANGGQSFGTAIVDVKNNDSYVVLVTAYCG